MLLIGIDSYDYVSISQKCSNQNNTGFRPMTQKSVSEHMLFFQQMYTQ